MLLPSRLVSGRKGDEGEGHENGAHAEVVMGESSVCRKDGNPYTMSALVAGETGQAGQAGRAFYVRLGVTSRPMITSVVLESVRS
jgi:hypothetical protein